MLLLSLLAMAAASLHEVDLSSSAPYAPSKGGEASPEAAEVLQPGCKCLYAFHPSGIPPSRPPVDGRVQSRGDRSLAEHVLSCFRWIAGQQALLPSIVVPLRRLCKPRDEFDSQQGESWALASSVTAFRGGCCRLAEE